MHTHVHSSLIDSPAGQRGPDLISACVHCGFCLETCPTYLDRRDERDSPRGRIYLIQQFLETGTASEPTRTHLDRCLGCRNCETACPSGMQYGELLDLARHSLEQRAPRSLPRRAGRWLLRHTLVRPALFRPLLRLGQWLRPLLPPGLRQQVPRRQARTPTSPRAHTRHMLLLDGCVQSAATPGTNDAAVRILDHLGIRASAAAGAGCCGAVHYHLGAREDGLAAMRRNIDAWWPAIEAGAEALVTTASGCGALVADYGELLAGDPAYAARARRVSELHRDMVQVLAAEDLAPLPAPARERVAVHTPCTLQHAQGLDGALESVLGRCGITLTQCRDGHLCCGSAGTYSLLHPAASQRLRRRKLEALTGDDPQRIVTANVGCQLHLGGEGLPVNHWLELLDPGKPASSGD